MTRAELLELTGRVRKRHNRRVLIVLAVMMVTIFGGFALLDIFDVDMDKRDPYAYVIEGTFFVIAILGYRRIFTLPAKDCAEFGLICPSCKLPLFSKGRLIVGGPTMHNDGKCLHCAHQLIDDQRVQGVQPLPHEKDTPRKLVKIALIQVVGLLLVYWLLWLLGVWR